MLCESISETVLRHPDKTVGIRGELRRLRVFFISIENLSNCFALVRSQCRDIYQRLHALVIDRSDDGASIGVTGQNRRPSVRAIVRFKAEASSDSEVKGIGAAITRSPLVQGRKLRLSNSSHRPTLREPQLR